MEQPRVSVRVSHFQSRRRRSAAAGRGARGPRGRHCDAGRRPGGNQYLCDAAARSPSPRLEAARLEPAAVVHEDLEGLAADLLNVDTAAKRAAVAR